MSCKKEELLKAYLKLLELEEQCLEPRCEQEKLTPRQIYYLQVIDGHETLTCSDLAECTNNSKPTVTDMINRFIRMDCVTKQRSEKDHRVYYIRLTPKGERIARSDQLKSQKLIKRIENCLTEDEIIHLIHILNKLS